MTYKRFLEQPIDLAPVGVSRSEDGPLYFCTPKGARIIGWAGVDGIHYCFVQGFSDMVFTVSPMNAPGEYVHPVAEDFTVFLRLLLSCGDAAALEQAWAWDEAQFNSFLLENAPMEEAHAALDAIAGLPLDPMENPFAYLKKLQAEFDYGRICFTAEYYDVVPQ